jgi:hypothetical protein
VTRAAAARATPARTGHRGERCASAGTIAAPIRLLDQQALQITCRLEIAHTPVLAGVLTGSNHEVFDARRGRVNACGTLLAPAGAG